MSSIYLPSRGVQDWRALLADPEKHWRVGYSAMTLALSWEAAGGLPPEIAAMFGALGPDPELLVGLPEHKVSLSGSSLGQSHSDLFAIVRVGGKTLATTIEGKVDESFDRTVGEWLLKASPGERQRLAQICELLGLEQPLPSDVYYQLLHRTAAAVLEARRFKADAACMIVHSFSPTGRWFDAFERFAALFGERAEPGRLISIVPGGSPPVYAGWAAGDSRFRELTG